MKQLLLLVIALGLWSCSQADQTQTVKSPETKATSTQDTKATKGQQVTASTAKPYQLLFFLNPNGRPCQMQDSILKKMGSKLTKQAKIRYIPTTNPTLAREMFNRYGIRALPTLIVLDAQGNSVKRFAPGIQNPQAILQAMGS